MPELVARAFGLFAHVAFVTGRDHLIFRLPRNMPTGSDLFALGDSAPTGAATTEGVTQTGGQRYDLFYEAANGLPEILQTNFTPTAAVPEPASVMLVGSTLIGLGWLRWHRRMNA